MLKMLVVSPPGWSFGEREKEVQNSFKRGWFWERWWVDNYQNI